MTTKQAGTAPAVGPPTKEVELVSESVAKANALRMKMQALGFDDNWIIVDTEANKPTTFFADRIFIASDTKKIYYDTGSAWVLLSDYLYATSLVFTAPSSIDLDAGSSADAVIDLQTILDGRIYHITEAAATPGIALRCHFTGITRIACIVARSYYAGSATHYINIELYNYDTTTYDSFSTLEDGNDYAYQTIFIPDDTNYISAGAASVCFRHPVSGNASHDFYLDYLALGGV